MSNDPYDPNQPPTPPGGPPAYPGYPPPVDPQAIRDRVQIPAILLIVVGILNLLGGLLSLARGAMIVYTPAAQMEQQLEQAYRMMGQDWEEMKRQGYSVETMQKSSAALAFGGGGLALLLSLLTILGGARMLALKSYGLAVFASLVTMIPCISPCACCLLGEGVGLWALIVLLNTEVRAAFR